MYCPHYIRVKHSGREALVESSLITQLSFLFCVSRSGKILERVDAQQLRPLALGARACGARQREYIVWKMREAHFPHYILPLWRGEAARASDCDGNQTGS